MRKIAFAWSDREAGLAGGERVRAVRADDLRNMLVLVAVMTCGLQYLAVESKSDHIRSPV
jgi:hypothetical protein